MNKNLWLLKRIFILGIIFIFFSSSYSYAIRPKRARGKATTSAAQRNHRLREKSKSRHPVATHAPARPVSAKPAGSRKTTYTQSDDLTAEVNAEIARQRQTRGKHKTKQEWIDEYNAHPKDLHKGTPMYKAFQTADQRVKKAEQNNETVDALDRQMSDIYRANLTKGNGQIQQKWLDEYNAHPEELHNGTPMYTAFFNADQRVKKAEQNHETIDPLDKQMSDIYRKNTKRVAEAKTKREWLDEYNAHPEELHKGTPMYEAFQGADQRVKKAEQNNETVDPLDKQMSDIYRANLTIGNGKTQQKWLEKYNAHPEELHAGTPLYKAFSNADQRVKKAEQNNETVDPLDKQMSDIYRANTKRIAEAKTKQEWLDEYNAHPEELHYGTPMYDAFRGADQRVKKAEQNNETVDPLDKQMSDIYRANTTRFRASQEWLDEYNAHPEELHRGTPMYNAFAHADQRVKKAEENNELVDPLDKQMSDIYRANTTRFRASQEWLDEYNAHPEELHAGTPMYNAFAHADQRVKKAEENNELVDPLDKQMSDIYRANTTRFRASQEWLDEYNAHPEELHAGTPMYNAFAHADHRVKKAEENNELVDPLDKQMSDIYRANLIYGNGKTQQKWIDKYNEHPEELRNGTPMYNAFAHADQRVKKAEQNNETVDPLDKQMSDIFRANLTQASPKTKQEWLDEYNAHPEELHKGTPMYAAFLHADQRVKKAEQNNETVDPLDKQMSDIYRANTTRFRASQEWLDEYNAQPGELRAGTPMYAAFSQANQRVKRAEQNNETVDPLDKQMSDIYRANTRRYKTTNE